MTLAACNGAEPTGLRPILLFGTDSPSLVREATEELLKAGLTFEFRDVAEVADPPDWIDDDDTGYLLYVAPDDEARAKEVYLEWLGKAITRAEKIEESPAVVLGEAGPLPAGRVDAIAAELARRVRLDQAVRRDPGRRGEMARVDAENRSWLTGLVREVGWIDAGRFGPKAANGAFLLVQHSGDRPLMAAALPEIEKDVRAGRIDAQPYALLYDRLHFMRGGKQRYGTQVVVREDGSQVVERLEDPDKVDERRREIGLGPLADYLRGFGRVTIER